MQADAEARGFSTRWSSVDALLGEVAPSPIYLLTLLREQRLGQLRGYRCLALHSSTSAGGGAVATPDVAPERLLALPALTLDHESRVAFSRVSALLPAVTKH